MWRTATLCVSMRMADDRRPTPDRRRRHPFVLGPAASGGFSWRRPRRWRLRVCMQVASPHAVWGGNGAAAVTNQSPAAGVLPLGRLPSPGRAARAPPSSIGLVDRGGPVDVSAPSPRPRTVDAPPAARRPPAAGPLMDVAICPPPDELRAVVAAAGHASKSSEAGGGSHRPPRPVAARLLHPPPRRPDWRRWSLGCAAAATAARIGGGGGLAAWGAGTPPAPPATVATRPAGALQTARLVSWLSNQTKALARVDHTRPRPLHAGGGKHGRTCNRHL